MNLTNLQSIDIVGNHLASADAIMEWWDPGEMGQPSSYFLRTQTCIGIDETFRHECKALVTLYRQMKGDDWADNTGWLTSDTHCSWYGVHCEDGYVTQLLLENNLLKYDVPAEIGDLIYLEILDISDNNLVALPTEMGNLAQLTDLDLSSNRFSTLPIELSNFSQLENLNLASNHLGATDQTLISWMDANDPDWMDTQVFDCTKVEIVFEQECLALVALYENTQGDNWHNNANNWLTNNMPCTWYGITCGPDGSITRLVLTLEEEQSFGLIGAIPSEIGYLSRLQFLNLANNQLNSIPTEISNLISLDSLNIANNQLSEIPPEIGNLTALTALNLADNQLTTLPAQIGNLSNLIGLYLDDNQLTQLPLEIGNLSQLMWLNLSTNQLSTVPSEVRGLVNLDALNLGRNQLDRLPASIGELTDLTGLFIDENQLGSLPKEIGDLSQLSQLNLHKNQLTTLPATIVNLTDLVEFDISENPLAVNDEALLTWIQSNDSDWVVPEPRDETEELPDEVNLPTENHQNYLPLIQR